MQFVAEILRIPSAMGGGSNGQKYKWISESLFNFYQNFHFGTEVLRSQKNPEGGWSDGNWLGSIPTNLNFIPTGPVL